MSVMALDDRLARADRLIAEAEERLACQREAIRSLAADGEDVAGAEALLRDMERHLALMHEHRCEIAYGTRNEEPGAEPRRRSGLLANTAAIAKLRRAGFTQEQVEALAEWLAPQAAWTDT